MYFTSTILNFSLLFVVKIISNKALKLQKFLTFIFLNSFIYERSNIEIINLFLDKIKRFFTFATYKVFTSDGVYSIYASLFWYKDSRRNGFQEQLSKHYSTAEIHVLIFFIVHSFLLRVKHSYSKAVGYFVIDSFRISIFLSMCYSNSV